MSKLEKDEEKKIARWCKSKGVLFVKFTPMGSRGWPDRIAIFPGGATVWTELKRRKKIPRELQFHRMDEINDMGGLAVWFDNAEACIEFYEDCLESAKEVVDEDQPDQAP